jgi:DNA-binding NtrC family response regulator
MHDADKLQADHLPKELTNNSEKTETYPFPYDLSIPPEGVNLDQKVDEFTFRFIEKAMQLAGGNISQAAKLLGIPRGTLRYKLEKYEAEKGCI